MNEGMELTEIRLGRLVQVFVLYRTVEHVSLASTVNCCSNLDVDLYCGLTRDDRGGTS